MQPLTEAHRTQQRSVVREQSLDEAHRTQQRSVVRDQSLSDIQSQVLAGLLAGQPVAAVAPDHGIHRSTIYNWRHEHPHFTFALDQARSRLHADLYDQLQDLAAQSLETLGQLLQSPSENVRLRVAQTLLRLGNPV